MDYDKEVLPNQTNNGTECPWTRPNTENYIVWKEDDMMEFTANELWFAPNYKECFLTHKFRHHGNKICGHNWQAQRLNETGDHILFP
jgi:hypothetical protein